MYSAMQKREQNENQNVAHVKFSTKTITKAMAYNHGIKLELMPPVFNKIGIKATHKLNVSKLPDRLILPFFLNKNKETTMHIKAHNVENKLVFFIVLDNRLRLERAMKT
jgi:hypothetical protein